ncbi:MAG: DUF2069 domain-containing protein [Proteobacteria bacterium]|nr:DUF2069 domain-containing protein [Pseudomonadota bacterium]
MNLPAAAPPPVARAALLATLAVVVWLVLWETVLAPMRPGLSWTVLKAVPLALTLPGLMRASRRARQWATLLLPWYAAEALTRAWSESGRHALVAAVACVLIAAAFVLQLAWFRAERNGPRGSSR